MIYIGGQPPRSASPTNRTSPYIESAGIPEQFAELIIPIPFNDKEALKEVIHKRADDDYLQLACKLTAENNIVLFFDEIQSAYKKSFQAAQTELGVIPDVTTIGKSIGGGFPLSAFCGKREIMDCFSPLGNVQHSGTFNAHLVPVLAGLAFMKEASKTYFYPQFQEIGGQLYGGIGKIISGNDLNMVSQYFGARFNLLLGRNTPSKKYEETFCHDNQVFLKILKECFEQGIYFHDYGGGPANHGFSIQHTREDISRAFQF